jgi:acetyltransferase-like isoleucine patch superfamily enzyme
VKHCVHPSDRAPGLMLGHDVSVAEDVEMGACVVIHSGTQIGVGCEVQDGAVLGKRPRLGRHSRASVGALEPLVLEAGSAVCAGAVVYAGARIERDAVVGDQAQVREHSVVGAESVIGRGTGVESDVRIGTGVRIQSNCFIAARTVVEDDVFVGPGVVTTNDDTAGRRPENEPLRGAVLRRGCRIGGGAVLRPGIEVGEEAFVAAGAVVTRDVPPGTVVMGVPARSAGAVGEEARSSVRAR